MEYQEEFDYLEQTWKKMSPMEIVGRSGNATYCPLSILYKKYYNKNTSVGINDLFRWWENENGVEEHYTRPLAKWEFEFVSLIDLDLKNLNDPQKYITAGEALQKLYISQQMS